MIQLIGSILVAGGMTAIGLGAVNGLKIHARALSALISSFEIMQSEICFKLTPIPEVIKLLSKTAGSPAKEFYKACHDKLRIDAGQSVQTVWTRTLENDVSMGLNEQERQILAELGAVLGRYDAEGQERAIAYAKRRLEIFLTRAERERDRQGKVYGTLGVVSGILAVIVLL